MGVEPSRVYQMTAPEVGVVKRTEMGSWLYFEAGFAATAFTVSGGAGGIFCQLTATFCEAKVQFVVSKATTSKYCVPSRISSGDENVTLPSAAWVTDELGNCAPFTHTSSMRPSGATEAFPPSINCGACSCLMSILSNGLMTGALKVMLAVRFFSITSVL